MHTHTPMPLPPRSAVLRSQTPSNMRYDFHRLTVGGDPVVVDLPSSGPERTRLERCFRAAATAFGRRHKMKLAVRILPEDRTKIGAWRTV